MAAAIDADRVSTRHYPRRRDAHSHAHHQIEVPLRGAVELETRAGRAVLHDHTLAVVIANEAHGYRGLGENRCLILDVPCEPDANEAPLWDAASERPFFMAGDRLAGLLDFIRRSRDEAFGAAGFRVSVASLILDGLTAQLVGWERRESRALAKAVSFVHRHCGRPLSVDEMAAAAHVSVATLGRLFRSAYGMPPAAYLRSARLAKARALLADGHLPIAQIAAACGYSEQSALTRALRRETGRTPGAYRSGTRPRA